VPELIEPRSWRQIPVIVAERDEDLLSIDRNEIVENFKQYGAVLFRSFSVGIGKFRGIVDAYSTGQVSYPDNQRKRPRVSRDGRVQKAATGIKALPLHSELSHTPFRPDVCWFHCVKAPRRGSETLLCDGTLLASALPNSIRHLLETRMLRYSRTTSSVFLQRLLKINDSAALETYLASSPYSKFYRMDGSQVCQNFVAPALHYPKFRHVLAFANNILYNFHPGRPLLYPTFSDGSRIPEATIINIRATARRYTFQIQWRDSDLLMFDNTRFMHGRRPIIDRQRTIWTQFSDAGFQ
jgi:alpha-ketoglutarate-dependent taurine dioxygenase